MKVICAWCEKVISEAKESEESDEVSHGICPKCLKKMRLELKESSVKMDLKKLSEISEDCLCCD